MTLKKAVNIVMPCFLIVLGMLIAFDIVAVPGLALAKGTATISVSATRNGKAVAASAQITEWEGQLLGTGTTPCEFTVPATSTEYTSYYVICTWEGNTKKTAWGGRQPGSTLPISFDFTQETPSGGPQRFSIDIFCGTLMTTNPATGRHYYDEGTAVSVSAIPKEGCRFDFWYIHNPVTLKTYTETANPVILKMDHDWKLTGHASRIPIPGEDGAEAEPGWREYLNEAVGSAVSMVGGIWLVLAAREVRSG